jgi:hypothetical protein
LFGGSEATVRLRVESYSSGCSTAVLFEGQLLPRKSPRGLFDRYLEELQTPIGFPLSIDALYDASSDNGRLVIKSGGVTLVQVSPLNRRFQITLALPTEEELCITALADE